MPNYCSNTLTLTHDDPAMIARAHDALERGELLQEFIPVPQELKDTMAGAYGDADKQRTLEQQEADNLRKFGYKNWYDYCVGEWGTKWDVGEQGCSTVVNDGHTVHANFESAWAPPVDAYSKLLDLGFGVTGYYYEPGMCFAGVWDNGDDDYYELGGMSSKQVAATLPQELDDCFEISAAIEEYERENEEELTQWIREGAEANKENA